MSQTSNHPLIKSGFIQFEQLPDGKTKLKVNPHPAQKEILTAKERFLGYFAATGSGKSCLAAVWLLRQVQRFPKNDHICLAPTYDVSERVQVQIIEQLFGMTEFAARYNKKSKIIRLPTGGQIIFCSMEATRSVQGIHAASFWCEEAGLCSAEAIELARTRTGIRWSEWEKGLHPYPCGQTLLTSNQYRAEVGGDWVKGLIEKHEEGNPEVYVVSGKDSCDNPAYSQKVLEAAKENLSEERFKREYTGLFEADATGLVYPNLPACYVESVPAEVWQGCKIYGAIDWGSEGASQADPFAAVLGALDRNNRLWIFWEHYEADNTLEENGDVLLAIQDRLKERGLRVSLWIADASRPEHIRTFNANGIYCKKGLNTNNSIAQGIDLIRNRIRLGMLKLVQSKCPGLVYEQARYKYKLDPVTNKPAGKPRDKYNHAFDALRLLSLHLDRRFRFGQSIDMSNETEEDEE